MSLNEFFIRYPSEFLSIMGLIFDFSSIAITMRIAFLSYEEAKDEEIKWKGTAYKPKTTSMRKQSWIALVLLWIGLVCQISAVLISINVRGF